MHTTAPGKTTILTEQGIPTGADVGFQVLKAASGTVAIGRTSAGVIERPSGSGNYVINFTAPLEGDIYLVVADWSDGILTPDTSRTTELRVTTEVQPGSSGVGAIADYVKMRFGGELWKGLTGSVNFGPSFIQRAIDIVKRRVMTSPPDTGDENQLNPLVLDYLGICAALELVPAARDYWASQYISVTQGDDPTELVTYANRAALVENLRDDLMRLRSAAERAAMPYIDQPVLRLIEDGPAIDEDSDSRATDDPRCFPTAADFPGTSRTADLYGYPRRSGVSL